MIELMTESAILNWIKTNLSPFIREAIVNTTYSEDLLAGMTMRETGFLISRYVGQGKTPEQIHLLMKGDYGQRTGEAKKQYHGWGYIQIDTGSYPDFINSGDWKDPLKSFKKAVSVLLEKKKELAKSGIVSEMANISAYNCGSYNARKGIIKANDSDLYTHQHNYAKEVNRYREIYKKLK